MVIVGEARQLVVAMHLLRVLVVVVVECLHRYHCWMQEAVHQLELRPSSQASQTLHSPPWLPSCSVAVRIVVDFGLSTFEIKSIKFVSVSAAPVC